MRLQARRVLGTAIASAAVIIAASSPVAHAGGDGEKHGHSKNIAINNNVDFKSALNTQNNEPPGPPSPICDAGSQAGNIVYTAIPADILRCPQVPSLGFEANATSEFGDHVGLSPSGGELQELRVLFNSYGCSDSGHWNTNDCVTTPGSTFTHPITANIYAVDNSSATPSPGALLATVTQSQTIRYRPSADSVNCTGADAGKWFNTQTGMCAYSYPELLTFTFPPGTTLPAEVIWTVAFNTTHFGSVPIGEGAACYATDPGCGYDSLNVGVFSFPGSPYVGTDIDPNGTFLDSSYGGTYCDGGAGGVGFLRLDTPCWTGYRPLGEIRAA